MNSLEARLCPFLNAPKNSLGMCGFPNSLRVSELSPGFYRNFLTIRIGTKIVIVNLFPQSYDSRIAIDLTKKKKTAITDTLPLPWSEDQINRYRSLQNELDKKGLTKLHDLSRERLQALLDEVEASLKTA